MTDHFHLFVFVLFIYYFFPLLIFHYQCTLRIRCPTIRLAAAHKWQELLVYTYRCTSDRSADGGRGVRAQETRETGFRLARIVQLLGGQCNITTAAVCHDSSWYFLFRSSLRRRRCERRKRRMRFYKPVHAFYIRLCIEGREKRKKKTSASCLNTKCNGQMFFLPFIYIPQVLLGRLYIISRSRQVKMFSSRCFLL